MLLLLQWQLEGSRNVGSPGEDYQESRTSSWKRRHLLLTFFFLLHKKLQMTAAADPQGVRSTTTHQVFKNAPVHSSCSIPIIRCCYCCNGSLKEVEMSAPQEDDTCCCFTILKFLLEIGSWCGWCA